MERFGKGTQFLRIGTMPLLEKGPVERVAERDDPGSIAFKNRCLFGSKRPEGAAEIFRLHA